MFEKHHTVLSLSHTTLYDWIKMSERCMYGSRDNGFFNFQLVVHNSTARDGCHFRAFSSISVRLSSSKQLTSFRSQVTLKYKPLVLNDITYCSIRNTSVLIKISQM
jgi:hypothetical protein